MSKQNTAMQNTTKKKVRKKHEKWKKNIAPDVIISQKKAKPLSKKNSLCVSNYFSMGNFTKNRSWKQKSIELFFTNMVSLITKNEIVNFGIGKTMSWTAQIPSMCSSPNIIVNEKKQNQKTNLPKQSEAKLTNIKKLKKIETLYRRRFWKKQKNNIITIIHQCYKIKHFSRHLKK